MIVQSSEGVTLVGGGPVSKVILKQSLGFAPEIVAADAGADRLWRLGKVPQAVIGDLDSISKAGRLRFADRLFPIREQATGDFDKALRSINAPFVLGLGFSGARLDHGLAVLNALVRHPDRRCFILSAQDVTFLAPRHIILDLPKGSRLSLFPLGAVRGQSQGLKWPLDGIDFAPDAMIGTSNQVTGPVQLRFDADKMLVILPRTALAACLRAFGLQSPFRGG